MVKGLNQTEKKILAIAFYESKQGSFITIQDCRKFYRTTHHVKEVVEFLHHNGYLALKDINKFIITDKGKSEIGVEEDTNLTKFQERT